MVANEFTSNWAVLMDMLAYVWMNIYIWICPECQGNMDLPYRVGQVGFLLNPVGLGRVEENLTGLSQVGLNCLKLDLFGTGLGPNWDVVGISYICAALNYILIDQMVLWKKYQGGKVPYGTFPHRYFSLCKSTNVYKM